MVMSGSAGNDIFSDVLGNTGLLTALKFNRNQEREADKTALGAIAGLYGHVGGAVEVFSILMLSTRNHLIDTPEFYSSRPQTENRIMILIPRYSSRAGP